jgi:hypothetical protein
MNLMEMDEAEEWKKTTLTLSIFFFLGGGEFCINHDMLFEVGRREARIELLWRQCSPVENDTCYVRQPRECVAKWIRHIQSLCTNTIHRQIPFTSNHIPGFYHEVSFGIFVTGMWETGYFRKCVYFHGTCEVKSYFLLCFYNPRGTWLWQFKHHANPLQYLYLLCLFVFWSSG